MADAPGTGEIRAAGMVLWRPSGGGREVALVHRPRYDDWSFPKGKLLPGEHPLLAAVREVAEETGRRAVLGRPLPTARYDRGTRPKRVDYWAGRPVPGEQDSFQRGDEVDAVDWLPVPAARDRLSYLHDAVILDDFAAGPADTVPLMLLRHASAGAKQSWPGDDLGRPLDAGGAAAADELALLLSCYGSGRVITSAAERCVATVRPYAAMTGAKLEIEPALTVGHPDGGLGPDDRAEAAAGLMARITADGLPAVICAHRENLPPLLAAACAALGAEPPPGGPLHKGGFWVLHIADGRLAAAEQHSLAGE
jgi:8-oxo-dGTP pyrophosphatase MutT (NUDIX family)/phosphohistidine phosphatase SixA